MSVRRPEARAWGAAHASQQAAEPRPIRVLVVSNMYPTSALPYGTFIKEQIEDLEAVGVKVAKVVKRDRSHIGYAPFYARSLHACLRSTFDLVHAHYGFHSALIPELIAGRPTVVTFHRGDALNEPQRNWLYGRLQRYVVARAGHIICVSREIRDALVERLGADAQKVTRLSCGVNTSRFAPAGDKRAIRRQLGLDENNLTVVFSGSLSERKGVDILFRCAQRMRDLLFVFVGDGPLKADLPNCRFVGPVANSRMPLWLNAGDIFALPSQSEGTPVAVLEAMACGLPVVCTDAGDCREVIADGRTGLIVPRDDPKALEAKIRYLADRARARGRIGQAARRDVSARYDGQVVASRIKNIYEHLLATRAAGGRMSRSPLAGEL